MNNRNTLEYALLNNGHFGSSGEEEQSFEPRQSTHSGIQNKPCVSSKQLLKAVNTGDLLTVERFARQYVDESLKTRRMMLGVTVGDVRSKKSLRNYHATDTALNIAIERLMFTEGSTRENWLCVLNVLLQNGADINYYNEARSGTLLYQVITVPESFHGKAVEWDYFYLLLDLLLAHGATLGEKSWVFGRGYIPSNNPSVLNYIREAIIKNPPIISDHLFLVVVQKKLKISSVFINEFINKNKNNPDRYNATNEFGETALHIVARIGDVENARLFLDAGFDTTLRSKSGTPLEHALRQGNMDVVALFFEFKKVSLCELILAVKNGHGVLVQKYLDGCPHGEFNVNAVDGEGNTLLYWAAKTNNADLVDTLLEKGADLSLVNNHDVILFTLARLSRDKCMRIMPQNEAKQSDAIVFPLEYKEAQSDDSQGVFTIMRQQLSLHEEMIHKQHDMILQQQDTIQTLQQRMTELKNQMVILQSGQENQRELPLRSSCPAFFTPQ